MAGFFDKKIETANGENFANKEHLDRVENSGQLLSKDVLICIGDKENPGSFVTIGGVSGLSFSVNNNIIPLAEMGSDKWLMLAGKTAPVNLQINRYFVNHQNFLSIASSTIKENSDNGKRDMVLSLTEKALSQPRDYFLILQWKKVVNGEEKIIRTEIKTLKGLTITAYAMSFGQGIVVMENCSGNCQCVTDTNTIVSK